MLEWRLALKLSRYHAKVRLWSAPLLRPQTDLLSLFPVTLGEYAELTTNHDLGKQPEG